MIKNIKKVTVKYNTKIVGYLADLEEGTIGFQYDEQWLKSGFSISPFSLPLESKVFIGKNEYFKGLFGVFQDSLPDGWGELLFRRKLAKLGINFDKISPITRLTLVSENGLGALVYEPSQETEKGTANYNDLDKLANECQKIFNDVGDDVNLDEIYSLGGSSGGARPKVHLKIDNEYWIVKFACSYDPKNVAELEYNTNSAAKKCAINVNEFKLFGSKICNGYFGAKRFDRVEGKRIHMISLSSLLETTHRISNLDYTHLFQVTQKICKNKDELYEVFKRMVFNVAVGNKDDHGKNFAFLYDEKNASYVLSPAYDLTTDKNKFEHEMTVNGNGNPAEKEFLSMALKFNLSENKCKEIIANIRKNIN